jgi:aspartate/methionine/tyrosine aminotransferase
MEWVKTQTNAPYNLANSGVKNYPLSELPVDFHSLALCGPGQYGYPPLKQAIADRYGVALESVVTAQGTSMANYLAMATVLEPGDEVLVERPGYPLLWESAEFAGAQVKFFARHAEDGFAVDLLEIKRSLTSATRLIVLTNLHNPSCALLDANTLAQIGSLAQSTGGRVLVDEVYLELLFDQTPETSFKLGPEFIVTSSLTKVYGLSGLRCGWVFAEPRLAYDMYRLNDLFGVNNPYVTDQISSVAFANLDHIGRWSRALLEKNRALANEFIASTPQLECEPVKVGTVIFPRLPVRVGEFCRQLRERFETVVTPGHFFGASDRVRIGIGGETAIVAEGLTRIHAALRSIT